jgi:hypothetical protein
MQTKQHVFLTTNHINNIKQLNKQQAFINNTDCQKPFNRNDK